MFLQHRFAHGICLSKDSGDIESDQALGQSIQSVLSVQSIKGDLDDLPKTNSVGREELTVCCWERYWVTRSWRLENGLRSSPKERGDDSGFCWT